MGPSPSKKRTSTSAPPVLLPCLITLQDHCFMHETYSNAYVPLRADIALSMQRMGVDTFWQLAQIDPRPIAAYLKKQAADHDRCVTYIYDQFTGYDGAIQRLGVRA